MAEYRRLFGEFLEGRDNLQVYLGEQLRFRSEEAGLKPLLSYIKGFASGAQGVTVFDRTVGNAAALLLEKAACREVYAQTGSQLAVETLRRLGIKSVFMKTVPHISNKAGNGMCPFEQASIGKSADEFYTFACARFGGEQFES